MFTTVKVQRINPVTYLFEDYHGKSVAGAFYEHELHRVIYPNVYLVEKMLRKKKDRGISNGWDSMDHTIHEYTKTTLFDKILIHIFCISVTNIINI